MKILGLLGQDGTLMVAVGMHHRAGGTGRHHASIPLAHPVLHSFMSVAFKHGPVHHLLSHLLPLLEDLLLLLVKLAPGGLVVVARTLGVERARVLAVADEVPETHVHGFETGDFLVRVLVHDDRVVVEQLEEGKLGDGEDASHDRADPAGKIVGKGVVARVSIRVSSGIAVLEADAVWCKLTRSSDPF